MSIETIEKQLGFRIRREIISSTSEKQYEDLYSYKAALRFLDDKKGLDLTIQSVTDCILKTTGEDRFFLFSLLGDLYHIQGDFNRACNCHMKALSIIRNDASSWIGLAFAIRNLDDIETFEKMIAQLPALENIWKASKSPELNKALLNSFLK